MSEASSWSPSEPCSSNVVSEPRKADDDITERAERDAEGLEER